MKALALTLGALVLLSGCLTPKDNGKAQEVESAEFLKDKHMVVRCDVTTSGNGGITMKVSDCDAGRIVTGILDDAQVEFSGQDDTGSLDRNYMAQTYVNVYYPTPHGNSAPASTEYYVENDHTGGFTVQVKFPVHFGLGTYKLVIVGENYENVSWWSSFGGYEGKALPDTEFVKPYGLRTGGGWF